MKTRTLITFTTVLLGMALWLSPAFAQSMMGDQKGSPQMMGMMKDMDAHVAALAEHLTAFEIEVARSAPDPKQVTMHTAAILKECAGMSMKPMTAKPARMK